MAEGPREHFTGQNSPTTQRRIIPPILTCSAVDADTPRTSRHDDFSAQRERFLNSLGFFFILL